MDAKMDSNELISALADGQLEGEELARAMDACADPAALSTWHAYHVIGDVLRSGELVDAPPAPQFLRKLTERLAQERVERPSALPPIRVRSDELAANDGTFRWKLVAGLASVAAFTAVGWSVVGGGTPPAQPQLASAPQPAAAVGGGAAETVVARSGAGMMIRDPKLDELLAAHRQLGGASALQMPAGFLRNATFEGPAR
jgi:sigma-E factor negative regulatory protein RseA